VPPATEPAPTPAPAQQPTVCEAAVQASSSPQPSTSKLVSTATEITASLDCSSQWAAAPQSAAAAGWQHARLPVGFGADTAEQAAYPGFAVTSSSSQVQAAWPAPAAQADQWSWSAESYSMPPPQHMPVAAPLQPPPPVQAWVESPVMLGPVPPGMQPEPSAASEHICPQQHVADPWPAATYPVIAGCAADDSSCGCACHGAAGPSSVGCAVHASTAASTTAALQRDLRQTAQDSSTWMQPAQQ
jgi:hypothetical protein